MKINTGFSSRRKSEMHELPQGAQRTSQGEVVWMRPLTLRQKLHSFIGVREEGSQLVEMALVAPILLVILTGMASFGMALYSQQQLGLATAGAIQAVATGASYITDPCETTSTDVSNALPGWNAANISYTLTIYSSTTSTLTYTWTGDATLNSPTGCNSAGLTRLESTGSQFQPATLQVSYPYSWFPIFTWAKNGSTFKPSGNLQTTQAAMIQ